ncbi:glycosyltransferase family 39 protein [Amycolatopsis samaneae]|uniref:Glycosyltransferase family 39 protein n=1 Tax=Amycolatopsis samaneae TaxID=664691 RepID=A0ABW5GW69_9PSEU
MSVDGEARAAGGPVSTGPPPMAWRPVGGVALALGAVLLATSSGYGYFRDELYFRLLGQDLAWGYRDQLGPVTPALARVTRELLGDTVWALRVPCALLLALTVLVVAATAREFGGGRNAQLLAATGTAVSVFPLMIGHVLLTSTMDLPLSSLTILCVVRALLRADGRWWLACGAVIGLALYNKKLVLLLALGIVVGLLLTGPRAVFRDRFLWLGALLAVLVGAPTLLHEVRTGWPMLETASALTAKNGTANRIAFVPQQLLLLGPFLVPVWLAGAVGLWRDRAWRPARALVAGCLVCAVLFLVTGGRPDYTVPLLLLLLAAGSVSAVRWLGRKPGRPPLLAAGLVLNAVLASIVALPVLPQRVMAGSGLAAVDPIFAGQTGWPELAAQTSAAYRSLPEREQAGTVVVTANYGQAGALDRFGADDRLPAVYSGHNQLYYRGVPPETATTVIAVGLKPAFTAGRFRECRTYGRIGEGHAEVVNDDAGAVVQVCRGPRAPWPALWPEFRHVD